MILPCYSELFSSSFEALILLEAERGREDISLSLWSPAVFGSRTTVSSLLASVSRICASLCLVWSASLQICRHKSGIFSGIDLWFSSSGFTLRRTYSDEMRIGWKEAEGRQANNCVRQKNTTETNLTNAPHFDTKRKEDNNRQRTRKWRWLKLCSCSKCWFWFLKIDFERRRIEKDRRRIKRIG